MVWNFDVVDEIDRLRREMNNLFTTFGHPAENATFPLMNVYDGKERLLVTAELPGLTKDQVKITFSEGVLTLAGEQKPLAAAKEMAVIRRERSEGEFEKSLRIPTKVRHDGISASFVNGILTITLPKAEEAKPKTITIEAK